MNFFFLADRRSCAAFSVHAKMWLRRIGIVLLVLLLLPILAVIGAGLLLASPLTIYQRCTGMRNRKCSIAPDCSPVLCSCCDCCLQGKEDCLAMALFGLLQFIVALILIGLLPITIILFATNACNTRFFLMYFFCAQCITFNDDD
jgi:hypothetical protein